MEKASRQHSGGWRRLLLGAVVAAAALFVYRGPVSALREGNADFALVYSSARAWLVGLNPYKAEEAQRAWQGAGGTAEMDQSYRGSPVLLYPPPTFAVLAPVAAVPWPAAGVVWALLSSVLWVVTLWAVAGLAGVQWRSVPGRAFWAFGLAFAPAHTCIKQGQMAIAAVALVAVGEWARRRGELARSGSAAGAGGLLGLGAAVKPQVAGIFTAYEGGRWRWRVAGASVAVIAVISAIAAARMELAHIPWWSSWRTNLAEFTRVADGDPTSANAATRHHLINLHYPLHTLTDNRGLVRWLVLGIVGAMGLAYVAVDWMKREQRNDLTTLAFASVVTLLVVYHRTYDASVLVFAIGWAVAAAMRAESAGERRLGIMGLVLLAPFLVPGSAILKLMELRGMVPGWVLRAPLVWETLIVPHAVWAILGLGILLIVARARERSVQQD